MSVNPVPEGLQTITPYYIVEDAAAFVDFTVRAFGATVNEKVLQPDGTVGHADCTIGDSRILVGQAENYHPKVNMLVCLYDADCDALFARAVDAGAEVVQPMEDKFYGDRQGGVKDPFGNYWWIGAHVEDVSAAELARRVRERHS